MRASDVSLTERRPVLFALLGMAIVVASTAPIMIRLSAAPVTVKVFYRLFMSTAILLPVAVFRYRSSFDRLSRRDGIAAVGAGLVLATQFLVWFESLEWTTVAASVTLAQTQVIFVGLGAAVFLNERITQRAAIGMVVGLLGAALVTSGGLVTTDLFRGEDPALGNGLSLLAGGLFAAYLLLGRSLRQRVATIPYLTVVYGVAALVTLLFAFATNIVVSPLAYPLREHAIFLGLALGPGIVAQGLVIWLLAYLRSAAVSVAFLAVPITSTLFAALVLAERPGLLTVVGGAVVLVGIYFTVRGRPTENA